MRIYTLLVIFLFAFNYHNAQVSLPNEVHALKIDEIIELDGILDESCWQKAMRIKNFTQREMNEGAPVTERTEVAVVYSGENIFIGVWCYDTEPDKISAKHMKRDFPYWTDDNFEIIFDTFLDKQNGYVFVINPNGSRSDVQTSGDGRGFNIDWNGVWDAETVINQEGWFGEIKIPFSTLKFPDKDVHVWGVNFERNIRRKKEAAFWQGWSRNYDFEHVSHAGRLNGLQNIYGKEDVEFKPYVTSGIERMPGRKSNILTDIGGDINYLITPTLKLNLTVNTDFAQVESDRDQIQLSRFSIYFPEKREFFLEAKDNFEYNFYDNAKVFYTRRIGLQDGSPVPIIGGIRLAGKEGSTNIGMLSIQTAKKGNIQTANYSVLRLSHDVLEKSNIGMIVTSKNQGDHYNYVYGVDGRYSTSSFFGNNNFIINGYLTHSITKGMSSGKSFAYGGFISYPNDKFDATIGLTSLQRNFNPELGFLEKENIKLLFADHGFNLRPESISWANRISIRPLKFVAFLNDETNKPETVLLQTRPLGITFKSGDWAAINIERYLEKLIDTFDIFENVRIPSGDYWFTRYSLEFQTFEGRSFSAYAAVRVGTFYDGKALGFHSSIFWNLNKYLNLSFDYGRNEVDLKYGKFLTHNLGGRLEVALNPKLFGSFFGQWNNVRDQFLLNFRVNWIPVVGSDFYLAINQAINTRDGSLKLEDTAVLGKFVWRFAV